VKAKGKRQKAKGKNKTGQAQILLFAGLPVGKDDLSQNSVLLPFASCLLPFAFSVCIFTPLRKPRFC
jgi:hypothetical protein